MELMQFTAIVLMIGLTLKLLLMPRRVEENSVTGRSRWLMFGGTALLGEGLGVRLLITPSPNGRRRAATVRAG